MYIFIYFDIASILLYILDVQSLLDHFGHFDVPTYDPKAQVLDHPNFDFPIFDAEAQIFGIQSPMIKPRLSIHDLRC